jgi:hypothetical protein
VVFEQATGTLHTDGRAFSSSIKELFSSFPRSAVANGAITSTRRSTALWEPMQGNKIN